MTPEEKQTIRSTIYSLIELTYILLKDRPNQSQADLDLLASSEETLKSNINTLIK